VGSNPWLAVGLVLVVLLVCAWIAWAVHVWSEHSARQGIGVLVVWPAIVAVLALISLPFIWAFRVIRASARSDEPEAEAEPESADAEAS
jgi:type VI protein secretion system component VasK